VGFSDIIGLEAAKQALREAILWPAVAHPTLFAGVRGNPRGLLLYGPPGCGKTMLARAAATELQGHAAFFRVRAGDVMSKFYGESQRRVQALEELVQEAAPAVVFLDEVDTLLGSRDAGSLAEHHRATTNALLAWMDGFGTGDERVFFLGATNRAEAIDEAALRRFGDASEVGRPSEESRLALLKHLICEKAAAEGHMASMSDADLRDVAQRTDNYSLADVDRLVRRAFLEVLRSLPPPGIRPGLTPADVPPVTPEHFQIAIAASTGTSGLSAMLKERAEKRTRL
jgi:SpoVK/Ycf46/Vps4 family AAA+-type ATPase